MDNQLILFHGMDATSEDQWLPYLRNHFTQQGWQVVTPNIPNSQEADLQRWIEYVESVVTLTPDTILVGHSAGCPLIVSLLQRTKVQVEKAILVAGFIEDIGHDVRPLIQEHYEWETIKGNCKEFVFINSDNDPYKCNDVQGKILRSHLGGTQIIMTGEGHFGTSEFNQPYPEFPLLIKLIE